MLSVCAAPTIEVDATASIVSLPAFLVVASFRDSVTNAVYVPYIQ